MPLQRWKKRLIAGAAIVLAIACAVGLASRSRRVRAAYHAFRDPDRSSVASDGDGEPPAAIELEQPEISGDFDLAGDLADGGAASLVLPDIPGALTQRTMHFVAYFASGETGRKAFAERFRRSGRYRTYVGRTLRDADLPEDLAWLPAILSGYDPEAVSPKGAAGLFQFMPETAARYGLAESDGIDERRSITRSTAAATTLLRELFDHYKSWDLALAAYNTGADRIDQAIEKLRGKRSKREADKPIELKDLADARLIAKETANFVPQVQAFAIVAANRGRFGLDDLDPLEPFDFGEIAVPPGTELRTVARAAGVPIDVVRAYNPDLLRPVLPQSGGDVLVNLPADRVSRALAAFPALAAKPAASSTSEPATSAIDARSAVPSAVASAPPPAIDPAADRWTLSNGVIVETHGTPSPVVKIAGQIELLEPTRAGLEKSGPIHRVDAVSAPAADLERALDRAGNALRTLARGDAGDELQRLANASRRTEVEKAAYGASWIALSDRLFPRGNALFGAVLAAPLLPLSSVVIAGPPAPGAMRVTVTIEGAERSRAHEISARALAGVLDPRPAIEAYPREDRISVSDTVPVERAIYAWIGPPDDDASSAPMRLAILLLAHDKFGKVARGLVAESHAAVHVRGSLEYFAGGSVVAIEAVPAVRHDLVEVGRELDRALDAFGERGPTSQELAAAKEQLRARIQTERGRAGSPAEPREKAILRLARLQDRAEAVTADEVVALVKRVFSKAHRVVVTTEPRG